MSELANAAPGPGATATSRPAGLPGVRRAATLTRRALAIHVGAAPWAAGLSIVLMVVGGLTPVAVAWFTRAIIEGLSAHDTSEIVLGVAGLGLLGLLTPVIAHVSHYVERETERRVLVRTQAELFTAVSAHPGLAELEDSGYHDRLRLAGEASRYAPTQLSTMFLGVGQELITIGTFAATLVVWSGPVAALVFLAAAPTLAAQIRLARLRGEMLERTAPLFRRQAFYAGLLLDMRAAKEIRLFGLGGFLRGRMMRELHAAQSQERRQDRIALWVDGSLAALTGVVSLVALAVFVRQVLAGHGTVGDLVVVIAALAAVQMSVSGLVQQLAMAGETMIMFGHYVDVTAAGRAPAVPLPEAPPLRHGLELDDVWFRYSPDHDWVLRGVTLTVPYGASLAVVGENGAGKSTLVKLICGFYPPTRGVIRWDGADITGLDPASLRARISATFQDFMSYELSAHDNIAVGDVTATDDPQRIVSAARAAGVDDVLRALPRGYDTVLTRAFTDEADPSAGVVLSGGQWQRMALARACLRDGADLLILDEPSSGLDVEAEHEIHRRLSSLRHGRASLLVSHRLNTVRDADLIVVLRDGRILEQGGHAALMAANGRYAELFRLQASGYDVLVTGATP
ncbi:multidrug ABC transporter permease [Actinoplanes lobatus]|uniref:ATP-binding cassette subfamily B protein n=2 Tax=Actinoplanes lobatus TaxID=113568 RepID=A0A7W7HJ10_9ACTN|nr:ABC transporter ATP-binding protein [Actinoplanes lobatus]MBB4751419.1 ATP-binding cassette subfamily B protein [Actinoplanes lobatus]GGN64000.1 multidrug ABC transporter permease [Actinoplanes lobatus]